MDKITTKSVDFLSDDITLAADSSTLVSTQHATKQFVANYITSTGIRTFTTVSAAETSTGTDNNLCYVVETDTFYRYTSTGSAYTDDNKWILSTGDGGDTRWIGVSGKYIYTNNYYAADNLFYGFGALPKLNNLYQENNFAMGHSAAALMEYGASNTIIGNHALEHTDEGYASIIIGYQAGYNIDYIEYSILIGETTGENISNCNSNIAIGHQCLRGLTDSSANHSIAIGNDALVGVTTAQYNIAIGHAAGYISSGSNNVLLGYDADVATDTNSNSIVIGSGAVSIANNQTFIGNASTTSTIIKGIYGNTDGSNPYVRVGSNGTLYEDNNAPVSGVTTYTTVSAAETSTGTDNNLCYVVETDTFYRYTSTGSAYTDDNKWILSTGDGGDTRWIGVSGKYIYTTDNLFYGFGALYNILYGGNNVAIGNNALFTNVYGAANIAIGNNALLYNDGDDVISIGYNSLGNITEGYTSVVIGSNAGYNATSVNGSVLIGFEAGYNYSGPDDVIAIGRGAAYGNASTASYIIALGGDSLYSITSGYYNTAVGFSAGYALQTGESNVMLGNNSNSSNISGSYNVAVGRGALQYNTTDNNVAVGYLAGDLLTTGTNNVILGYDADVATDTNSNSIVIGSGAVSIANNQTFIGNSSTGSAIVKGIYGNTNGANSFVRIGSDGTLYQDNNPPATVTFETSTGNIKQDGAVSVGVLSTVPRADHIHPTDTSRQAVLTPGSISETTSSVLTITNGSNSTVGPNVTIQVAQANTSTGGYLSAADWNAFNNSGIVKYSTVSVAETSTGIDNDICYVVETESWYRYESSGSAYTVDHLYVLSTGDAGNTRRLAVSGKYTNASSVYFNGIYANTSASEPYVRVGTDGKLYRDNSSLRYKKNITDIEIDTAKIYSLRPVSYNSISAEDTKRHIGLIAEEVAEILPEVVGYADGKPDHINYDRLVVPLISEIKKLKQEIEELKKRV